MSKKTKLSAIAIAAKLKARVNFIVATANDRQRVLTGAKFLGLKVSTRKNDDGTFTVFPV
jgi:hypothetical protein